MMEHKGVSSSTDPPLIEACKNADLDLAAQLLQEDPMAVNHSDGNHASPLITALTPCLGFPDIDKSVFVFSKCRLVLKF